MIFKGQLEVTANNKCWLYNVTQCVFDNVKISFDFDGVREGARYTGHCVAYLEGLQFKGVATFVYQGFDSYEADVKLTVKEADGELHIDGVWQEQQTYKVFGELERCF